MALLTHGLQVVIAALFDFATGQVRRGQYHLRARYWMLLAMLSVAPAIMISAALSNALALSASPLEPDPPADLAPVLRVTLQVLSADRH